MKFGLIQMCNVKGKVCEQSMLCGTLKYFTENN